MPQDFQIEIVEAPLDNREDLCTAKVGPDTIAVLWASAKSGWGMGGICPRKKWWEPKEQMSKLRCGRTCFLNGRR